MTAAHYAHHSGDDQNQGLHYGHFALTSRAQVPEYQRANASQTIRIGAESAKTG
jgi:hypothetical protein